MEQFFLLMGVIFVIEVSSRPAVTFLFGSNCVKWNTRPAVKYFFRHIYGRLFFCEFFEKLTGKKLSFSRKLTTILPKLALKKVQKLKFSRFLTTTICQHRLALGYVLQYSTKEVR